ncbi:hypothetical protein BJ878DRAFT_410768 [Calycina marina]|uniref:Inner centromere protein ARK-binding domain-containing protein n=1 Tax=Calycina marina TaxID=1763456 RepID=A0A9P7ZCX5_9HELO|nr:hypothetical protein BJ878DRAFT_410768 [Calycina marina]
MATMRGNARLPVGSAAWISEERAEAMQIAETEAEEFGFSARNEVEWINEHMAEIFNKDPVNVAEIFKTPGKLRGKTAKTVRKANPLEVRAPLSDVFSTIPREGLQGLSPVRQAHLNLPVPAFRVAEDAHTPVEMEKVAEPAASMEGAHPHKLTPSHFDSGYSGSQYASQTQTQPKQLVEVFKERSPEAPSPIPERASIEDERPDSSVPEASVEPEERRSTEGSFHSAKEDQTRVAAVAASATPSVAQHNPQSHELNSIKYPVLNSPDQSRNQPASPQKKSPERPTTIQSPAKSALPNPPVMEEHDEDEPIEDAQSPSEKSSPIRPPVRKPSLNFAPLPGRTPIKRQSHTSQIEQSRTSYYGRLTGGKSLGNARQEEQQHNDEDEYDVDVDVNIEDTKDPLSRLHNKTSTQRLQDQIRDLGKSQPSGRPNSKSFASSAAISSQMVQPRQSVVQQDTTAPKSPLRSPQICSQRNPFTAPGAFPEDEEDSWIGPPNATADPSVFSPRPRMTKSHTTDVMEDIHGKDSIRGAQFNILKRGESLKNRSPMREPAIPERTTSALGHGKSVSTSVLRSPTKAIDSPAHKLISVSNPHPLINSNDTTPPPKSISRSYRGSPLKAAKDKFSSILKNGKSLFGSSAAASADAKASMMSPAVGRAGVASTQEHMHPVDGGRQVVGEVPSSPGKASVRRTRASTERQNRRKEEEARETKETKGAQKMADKLEKERQKEHEKARLFHLEQEKVAAMQREVEARKEQERQAKASQASIPRATRTSPRKTTAQLEAEGIAAETASTNGSSRDVEMDDAPSMPPPAIPRPKSQIGRPPPAKRPLKPGKDVTGKVMPPTRIKVDTASSTRSHVGQPYHPSNSTLGATLQESLGPASQPAPPNLKKKASTSSITSTASKANISKLNAGKASESAARRKEQEELTARRKRELKEDNDRQRAANKEEERRKEEQQRRQEQDRQRTIQREREHAAHTADAKKHAARQAAEKKKLEMERAKQNGAPPPAIRPQTTDMDKPLPSVPREYVLSKGSQMNSSVHRSQEEGGRPFMQNTAKVPPKRPLQQDMTDEHHSRPTIQRNPASYQTDHHAKRRKTSEHFDNDDDMSEPRPKMTAPPIRQSTNRAKDTQPQSVFKTGYTAAPPPASLHKAAMLNQLKPGNPLDMSVRSNAPIPFASNSNQGNAQHKTPARPNPQHGGKSAKSAAKSSPRYQNGENIELPDINTDSEDDDDDDEPKFPVKGWTNSPNIRDALMNQEGLNPEDIFGQPGPIDLEEVFSKNKERFHKFRPRTSSANWTGQDRLTQDEIRKDLEGRDKVRRHGGWTYDAMV